MILLQYLPEQQAILCDGLPGLRKALQQVPITRGATMLNLVVDRRGRTVGNTGSSRDISNEIDYQSLMALRRHADYILTSAKTARVEKYRRSRMAPLVLMSESGNFDDIPAVVDWEAGPHDSLVYLVREQDGPRDLNIRYSQPWVRVIEFSEVGKMFSSANFVVAETGLYLSKILISSGLIQEIAISVVGVRGVPDRAVRRTLGLLGLDDATPAYMARVDNTFLVRFRDLKLHALKD